MDELTTDVGSTPEPASTEAAVSSPVVTETSGESQGSVTATEAVTTEAQSQAEVDPLEGVPTAEELAKLTEQKVPYSEALARLRPAYESAKAQLAEYEPLAAWKPIVETIGDPLLAQSAHELVSAIHTPDPNSPAGFTPRPFLDKIDAESPGTAQVIFDTLLRFPETDPQGRPSTVVRELYRSHGLDPDRIDEYRNIDKLRASSGVVTQDELAKIDPKYHEAFKGLSREAQEDVLSLGDSNPLLAEEHLRNAQRALASEQWEKQQAERDLAAKQAEEQAFQQQLTTAVEQDVTGDVMRLTDSIHQSLSSQWKPSGDAEVNEMEYDKILGTLAALQNPAYRHIAERALKRAGVELNGFDELTNQWLERRSAQTTFEKMGDKWQGQRAKAEADRAYQRIQVKLSDYALKLAQGRSTTLANQSSQQASQLAAASARFVPSGTGQTQEGFQNPYAQNPHPVGSQEYYAFNRKLDREYKVTGASMFG